MIKQRTESNKFFQRAKAVTPNGVSSNYRYYSDEQAIVVADAQDGYMYDFDGNRYIDYRLGWGPVLVGHANRFVNDRVKEAIDRGVSFAGTQTYEASVCERIIDLCPGIEMVRLANTGTECTMHALRLARGVTGRDLVLKFEGSYHGAHDFVMWSTMGAGLDAVGDRRRPDPVGNSLGVPAAIKELVVMAPWNDEEVLGEILAEKGDQIAAIIVEPMLGNANGLLPNPTFLPFLRQVCDRYGIVLIFDEVKTGFRIAPGGAREFFNVIPDLSTYAKAMGNGYPVAAFGGKKEMMMELKYGGVFQGGTYTGNVVSTAAADATLELIQKGEVFPKIEKHGRMLQDGIKEICSRHGVPVSINGAPGMFGVCFSAEAPRDWRELKTLPDWSISEKVYDYMIDHGVMPERGGVEPFFVCASHTDADAEETLGRFEEGLASALNS